MNDAGKDVIIRALTERVRFLEEALTMQQIDDDVWERIIRSLTDENTKLQAILGDRNAGGNDVEVS